MRLEAEVVKESGREDGAVVEEPASEALVARVPVSERLEGGHAAVTTLTDRGQEQALQHPGRVDVGQVGTGDQHRIAAGRAGGQVAGSGEAVGRPILDQADHLALVDVQLAPGAELVLGVGRPAVAVCRPRARAATATTRTPGRARAPAAT